MTDSKTSGILPLHLKGEKFPVHFPLYDSKSVPYRSKPHVEMLMLHFFPVFYLGSSQLKAGIIP